MAGGRRRELSPIAAEVAGVDGCKGGWVAVLAGEPPVFERAHLRPRLAELLAELAVAAVVGVDMPIGLSDDGWRPSPTPPPGRGCGGQDRACS